MFKLKSVIFSFAITLTLFLVLSSQNLEVSFAQSASENRVRLQAELDALEVQIREQQAAISNTQLKGKTLANDISILKAQIEKKKSEIKSIDYKIANLSNEISDKNDQLLDLSTKLGAQKVGLVQILKKSQAFDEVGFTKFIFDERSLSEYFKDGESYTSLQDSINKNLNNIKDTSNKVTEVKNTLEDHKDKQVALKVEQQSIATKIANTQKEKDTLLKETKGQEALYQKQLTETKAKAAKIRSALFALAGGSSAISFGVALDLANSISKSIDIEPAFLLAILTQETNLGANTGSCYLTDTTTGAGVSIKGTQFSNVMKASRDVTPFLNIVSALGLDYTKTRVSCPIPSAGGYGGAMGPAQFIPSTWMLFDKRIKANTGVAASNPWDNTHAFMASALYLTDLGATRGDYTSMIRAACKYYGTGGSSCSYGKSVMNYRDKIQANIDYLKEYGR